jgi:peroxiredoxin
MMKKVAYFLVLLILGAACSTEPHYVIKGKIEGSDSITFLLQKREEGKIVTIDSAISVKGSFTMKGGAVKYPELVQLVAGNTRKATRFYLENSEIGLTGSMDSLNKAVISGSKSQTEYESFIKSTKPFSEKYTQASKEMRAADEAADTAKVAEMRRLFDVIDKEMLDLQKNYIKNNPDSYISASILESIMYYLEADEIESMINAMDATIAAIPQMLALKEKVTLMKRVAVGQKAPDFTLNDVNGNPVSLYSKTGTKLLLVDFWAAWCGPCRRENPNVVKVWEEFNKKGFDVFGVSLDQEKDAWVKAIADDKLTWTQVSDLQYWNSAAAKLYVVSAIPSNFLLDESGTIIARNITGEDLYNKVKEVLGEK